MFAVTYACFDCRRAIRREADLHLVRSGIEPDRGQPCGPACSECGQKLRYLGADVEVPPKRDVSAWKRLERELVTQRITSARRKAELAARYRHAIDQRIADLRNRGPGREQLIEWLEEAWTNFERYGYFNAELLRTAEQ